MGLFGGSSKTNTSVDTNVDVAVNPVFTVGIDVAETFAKGADDFGKQVSSVGQSIGSNLSSIGANVSASANSFTAKISDTAILLATAGVGVAVMFVIAGKK